ncbi:N-acetylmuramoyl-L-alanine amidase [bacterium]|nr:N-acetylmuramoyl-L-alanine amidase [bacterium]
MQKIFIILFLLILGAECFAFDIVYPKKNNVVINAKSAFFIGSSKTPFTINGKNVPLHPSGGFAYVVDLKEGDNTFVMQSDDERKIYVITKPRIKTEGWTSPQFKKYDAQKTFYVITDKAPLRSTPVESGINRMAHLQRNILLNVDGEKGGLYRVVLGDEKYGWIAKTNVKTADENYVNTPAKLLGCDFEEDNEFYNFIFHFDKKVPYEISEGEKLSVKFFNVEEGVYSKDFPYSEITGGKKLAGYGGEYLNNDFIWKIRKPLNVNHKKPLKNINITIDAGHGGNEFGAIGCLGDKEKDINLSIAKFLENELNKRGANVVMTRDDDIYTGLSERVAVANYTNSSIFISIHGNALPDGLNPNEHSGVSIYYYYDEAKPLANVLINSITEQLGINNDKVRQASFAVVRNTNALSVLIETAYLINPEDNSKLISKDFQKAYAKAIADGLEIYLKESL